MINIVTVPALSRTGPAIQKEVGYRATNLQRFVRMYSPSLPLDSYTYSGPTRTRRCDYSAKLAWAAGLCLGRPVVLHEEAHSDAF
jgi:hypothetical protein